MSTMWKVFFLFNFDEDFISKLFSLVRFYHKLELSISVNKKQ